MEEWQERVVKERDELRDKYTKLDNFMNTAAYAKLNDIDKILLDQQYLSMIAYKNILDKRIERFKEGTK